ncbi:hypothetical protein [Streptomyces ochraceiscleroticus]|uniref:Mobile element transfer n=1 Tax=Streptomyces ochraceiscleroticus TaxID=47761 RepID=A0ABW1MHW8_9ACTN|nr:hypothetical protein [Streptomyces ochraceiscleroticus]
MPYAIQDPQQITAPDTGAGATGTHRTTTTERGAFCLARCSCGWSGPARRARSQARTDAERHAGAGR